MRPKEIWEQGVNIIPVSSNKRPLQQWAIWQTRRQPDSYIEQFPNETSIALIGGFADVLIIDFDDKHKDPSITDKPLVSIWWDEVKKLTGLQGIPIGVLQATPSKGHHLIIRCKGHAIGNESLWNVYDDNGAKRFSLIETRGHGGYALIYPSPGYRVLKGDIRSIPYIDSSLLDAYIAAAKGMDSPPSYPSYNNMTDAGSDVRPGDRFNKEASWQDMLALLEIDGWKVWKETDLRLYLTRPGKDSGISGDIHKEKKLFKSFSTSTIFEAGKGYTAFSLLSILQYDGDFSAAARNLSYNYRPDNSSHMAAKQKAYGDKELLINVPNINNVSDDEYFLLTGDKKEEEKKTSDWFLANEACKFDFNEAAPDIDFVFHYNSYRLGPQPLASGGMIIPIKGGEKVRKSLFLHSIIGGAIGGVKYLGLDFDLRGKSILFFDTEQPWPWFVRDAHRIKDLSGGVNIDLLNLYNLRDLSVDQRIRKIVRTIVEMNKIAPVGIIVIDGVVDICKNFNDIEMSVYTVELLMRIASYTGAVIFPVLHTTKSSDAMRGHLGSILAQKSDGVFSIDLVDDGYWSEVKPYRFRAGKPFGHIKFTHGDGITSIIKVENPYE